MQTIKAEEVVQAVKGELLSGDPDTKITGVSTDTRTIKPGDLFFALTCAEQGCIGCGRLAQGRGQVPGYTGG